MFRVLKGIVFFALFIFLFVHGAVRGPIIFFRFADMGDIIAEAVMEVIRGGIAADGAESAHHTGWAGKSSMKN